MMSGDNELDILAALEGLSEEEKQVAIEALKQIAAEGDSSILNELKYGDFEEIPVDIHTFLHEKPYLGNALYDRDGRFTLFPYWEKTLEDIFPDNLTTAYNTVILTGAIGIGKAQPLDSLVLTEQGFKRMGDLGLTDKIYGPDGNLHKLIGIFPQGKKQIYKLTFSDGSTARSCDEHLWTVFNVDKRKWETVELKELIAKGIYRCGKNPNKNRNYKIPVTNPIQFNSKHVLPVDPYILGVLIGDGCLTTGMRFANDDPEIIDHMAARLIDGYEIHKGKAKCSYSIRKVKNDTVYDPVRKTQIPTPNKYLEYIKQENLDVRAENKHIPEEYLYSSIADRIALLQGLMDTDGTITKDGSVIEFATVSEQLKTDLMFLVQSLGGVCHVRTKQPYYRDSAGNKKPGRLCYNIGIKLPTNIVPFKLSRKVTRISPNAWEPSRYITDIKYEGEEECQCIYLDSEDHLYLTDNFVVTHNSTLAVICLLYMLYRLLCLKDPYLYYGMQPIDKISISLMNITIENAKGVALDKLNQMILASDWFMSHGEMRGTSNLMYHPNKHIEFVCASSNNQIIGRALFASFEDEVNFDARSTNVERQKARLKQIISQVDSRMASRFLRGDFLPTLNIIASSKASDQSFLDEYIETKKKNESKTTLVIDEHQWVVDSRKQTGKWFKVAIGDRYLPNELIPEGVDERVYKEKGYNQILEVPSGYLEKFRDNIELALTDIAGISTASSVKYISGISWNAIRTDKYENPFVKDVIEVGNNPNDHAQYANFFDLSKIPDEYKAKPLWIHLDMSSGSQGKGDKTGLSGVWITGKRTGPDEEDITREMYYRVAFSVSIKAPKGDFISFAKHRTFIRWLRDQGFAIKGISCDTWGGPMMQQELKSDGFEVATISVDRVDARTRQQQQYAYFKTAMTDRRLEVYSKCDFLTEEVLGLERLSDGHIEHPEAGKSGSKDQIDAVVGALWNASLHAAEYAYSYGDSVDAALNVSMGDLSDDKFREQWTVNFQEELAKLYMDTYEELDEAEKLERIKRQEEYNAMKEISDGIFAF